MKSSSGTHCRRRIRLIAVLLAVVVISAGSLRALERVPPESVGLSSERLRRVTEYLEREVAEGRIAGAVALVARHGRLAYLATIGSSRLEENVPMRADTLFRIASMTKTVTSVAVMMLVEEGELQLSDPLSSVLPRFAGLRVLDDARSDALETRALERPVTIHDLLTHTSGITYGWFGPERLDALYREAGLNDLFVPVAETTSDRLGRLAKLPLKFQPGSAWDYGLSLDVLGHVVEVVSGLRLDQFFRERIFRPLGMRDTWFYVPREHRSRLAGLYTTDANGKLRRVGRRTVSAEFLKFSGDYCFEETPRFFSGGGGLVSTATDYVRFLEMLLEGGTLEGTRLLRRETVARMTRNQIGDLRIPAMGHGDGFGYGFGVLTARGRSSDLASVGSYSWGGIFNTYYWVDPQEKLIGILMTQLFPFDHLSIRGEFKRLAYEAIDESGFERVYWYEKGVEHGNPFFNGRQLRVNAPEASLHPVFSRRSEPRSSGLARILVDEDLLTIRSASLYCEIWGGHPGTVRKRVSINGRSLYAIPEVGSASGHCTHQYPRFSLKASDLVRGYNALQFACDQGETFWGHYIVDNAGLSLGLPEGHSTLVAAGLSGFSARVEAASTPDGESMRLRLVPSEGARDRIAVVHFQGRYDGYDENGDGWSSGWHGMTKGRRPYGVIGAANEEPFEVAWNTRLLASQSWVGVRAVVRLRDQENLLYTTPVLTGLSIPGRPAVRVSWHHAADLPDHFWSRAGRRKECTIDLGVDPADLEAAELHVVAWTGGAGSVADYFTLNGHHFPVAEGHDHEVVYSRLPVDPSLLRRGANRIVLMSDTEHHGIEILRPGPALVVRARVEREP